MGYKFNSPIENFEMNIFKAQEFISKTHSMTDQTIKCLQILQMRKELTEIRRNNERVFLKKIEEEQKQAVIDAKVFIFRPQMIASQIATEQTMQPEVLDQLEYINHTLLPREPKIKHQSQNLMPVSQAFSQPPTRPIPKAFVT